MIEYLERMIEGCDNLGGMEREKAVYQSVLKEYRKQCNITDVVVPEGTLCDHPRSERTYIGSNMLRCNKCGKEFK